MARKDQHSKNKSSDSSDSQAQSSSQENIQNDENEEIDQQHIFDNKDIPLENFRRSFSVFKNKKARRTLKTFINVKNDAQRLKLKNTFLQILGEEVHGQTKQKKENCLFGGFQHFILCEIPQESVIFIHIFQIEKKRCNIKVTNSSGYIFTYFCDVRLTRRFYKIYKLIKKLNKKCLYVICDEFQEISKEASFIKKISDYTQNFCYYSRIQKKKHPQKFLSFNLVEEQIIDVRKKGEEQPSYVLFKDDTFWFFSQVLLSTQQQCIKVLQKMREIQIQVQSLKQFSQIKLNKDSKIQFLTKCILKNYLKSYQFQSQKQMVNSFLQIITENEAKPLGKTKLEFGDKNSHFPEPMRTCKNCHHCQQKNKKLRHQKQKEKANIYAQKLNKIEKEKRKICIKQKNTVQNKQVQTKDQNYHKKESIKQSKTKYRCEGCSASAKKQIPLCIQCFKQYHIQKQQANRKNALKLEKLYSLKKRQKQEKQEQKREKLMKQNKLQYVQNIPRLQQQSKQLIICEVCSQLNTNQKQKQQQQQQNMHQKYQLVQKEQEYAQIQIQNYESDSSDIQFSQQNSCEIPPHLQKINEQLLKNQEYVKLLQEIARERQNYLKLYEEMLKDQHTKIFAQANAKFLLQRLLTYLG